jgi:L-malate glycosyltransferase
VKTIHQLVATLAPFDAVSNETRAMRDVLRAAGYESDIYAENIHSAVRDEAEPLSALQVGAGDLLLLHYSIWSAAADRALDAGVPLIVRYHNVTPAHWFEGVNEMVAGLCRVARARLPELAPHTALALADSTFNALDLEEAGIGPREVLPILLDDPPAVPSRPDEALIVTVARLVPNKRIDEVLRTFACYERTCAPGSRLAIVGGDEGFEVYGKACRRLASALRIHDPFLGSIDEASKQDLLARASAYLMCSEHEGFCVPLVEAMRHDLPIVARAFGAVPETLGDAGIAAPEEANAAELAELLHLAVTDAGLGAAMAAGRRERLAALAPERVGARLLELVGGLP